MSYMYNIIIIWVNYTYMYETLQMYLNNVKKKNGMAKFVKKIYFGPYM